MQSTLLNVATVERGIFQTNNFSFTAVCLYRWTYLKLLSPSYILVAFYAYNKGEIMTNFFRITM